MKQQLSGMKDNMSQMISPLPANPIDIGDSWKTKYKMASDPNSPMTVEGTYTLKSRRNGVAFVKFDGTVSNPQGLNGTMNGDVEIDEKTGMTKKSVIDMKMAGKAGLADLKVDGKVTTTTK